MGGVASGRLSRRRPSAGGGSARVQRRGTACRSLAQPPGELVRLAALGGGRSGERVVSEPRRVRTALQKHFGGCPLAAVCGAPQRVVEFLLDAPEFFADSVGEAERRGLPEVG